MKKNKKIRNKIYTIIALLFLIIGTTLLVLPILNEQKIKKQTEAVNVSLSEITAAEIIENNKSTANFDFNSVRNINATETWGSINEYNKQNIIGQLVIPSQKINLTVFKGLDESGLVAGVGTMKEEQTIGQGNFTIAGHRAKSKGVLFHSLMDVSEGDEIRYTDKQNIYIYRVREIIETDPYAFYMLEDNRTEYFDNKPIITLMTCYFGSSDSRWFVVGSLETIIPYSEAEMVKGV